MFTFSKSAARMFTSVPKNFALAAIIGCTALWVAVRCVVDVSRNDGLSLGINLTFTAFLSWRGWVVAIDDKVPRHDLVLLLPTLAWATWMAHCGIDFFIWWFPLVLLIAFFSSSQLVFPLMSISVMLISIMLLLTQEPNEVLGIIGAMSVATFSVALYRVARDNVESTLRLRERHMRFLGDAARLLHAEVDEHGEVVSGNALLLREAGLSFQPETLHLCDFFHPGDHGAVMQARRNAMDVAPGAIVTTAACDCRLLRQDGSALWVHAQFVRSSGASPRAFVALVDIDKRVRIEEALHESKRKLASQGLELAAQFDAAKSALHARQEVERLAQHDLRSPLKSIEAAAALLRKGRILSTNEEHLLTSIEHTAARALSMVTMSLDLYRMEEGTFRFVPETIDLVTIGRGVIAELGHHARSKNVRLEFDPATRELKAIGNPLLTGSIVENLVRNALEAAPEDSAVTLGLYQGARVGLLIHNEGEVNESIRDEFFEKYVTHGKRGGLGLGTYSARLIARAQGGDLTMSSSATTGTLLALKLRRSPPPASDHAANSVTDPNPFGPSLPGSLLELPVRTQAATSQQTLDMLVVDDDDHNWLLLLNWLPKHVGARRAINGREAIDALTASRPDLIIMDLEMPVMNGFEALHRIREMQSSAAEEPSVIYAFTGYDDPVTTGKVRDAGFDGILTKPARREELEDILRMISATSTPATIQGELWIEKTFVDAFPAFVDSRRALISDIERAVHSRDMSALRRAAHTLAGSPAIHGFDTGISICRRIVAMANNQNLLEVDELVAELKKLLANPIVR